MSSNTRFFWGKRRFAGLLLLVVVGVVLVSASAYLFTRFARTPRKETSFNVALAPTHTSTIAPISPIIPKASVTGLPSRTVVATGTVTTKPTTNNAAPRATPTAAPPTITGSPLLFGTNMVLTNSSDRVITSIVTQNLMRQIHIQIIRMPIRTGMPESVNVLAAQAIKNIGATPLIILHSQQDAQSQASNTLVIADINRIFGNGIVYYEFGNEDDFLGVPATTYTASWNASVPKLKKAALNGQFIGPVNFHYDPVYLSYFLTHVTTLPNEVSWHEYACRPDATNDVCMAHLANWTTHIQSARAIISTTGKALPIMITEWNYDATPTLNDGKNNNSTFMHDWTAAALRTLAQNNVFASMQYSCTDRIMPLITIGGVLTAQGTAFSDSYSQLVTNH